MRARPLATAFTLAGLALTAPAGEAGAQEPTFCGTSSNSIPDGANNFIEVEGPLTAYDYERRTMSTLGVTVHFPDPAFGETFEFDVGGGMTTSFADLVSEQNELKRKILGDPDPAVNRFPATIIAIGRLVATPDGCAVIEAEEAEFLYGEHVVVGPLTEVNVDAGTFNYGGVKILMSDDPRVPKQLLDASGNDKQIDLAVLAQFQGTLGGGDGFMERGILRGFIIETAAFRRRTDGRENVIAEVARWDADDQELRVVGFVTLDGTALPQATHVEIYTGPTSGGSGLENPYNPDGVSDGVSCTGTRRGAPIALVNDLETPGQKTYTYRRQGVPEPVNVCVRTVVRNADGTFTAHGTSGSNSRAVDVR